MAVAFHNIAESAKLAQMISGACTRTAKAEHASTDDIGEKPRMDHGTLKNEGMSLKPRDLLPNKATEKITSISGIGKERFGDRTLRSPVPSHTPPEPQN